MEGFVLTDYMPRLDEAMRQLTKWMKEGKLIAKEQIEEGLETFPEVLLKLFHGENVGKLILKISDND